MSEENKILEYHKSLTNEFRAVRDRVFNLIGADRERPADVNREVGEFKEAILINTISRHLPSNFRVGTGFVFYTSLDDTFISKQIDVLIVDTAYPLLFSEGSFLIASPNSVRAIIEVKSSINSIELTDVMKWNKEGSKICNYRQQSSTRDKNDEAPFFNGVFGFTHEWTETEDNNRISLGNTALQTIKSTLKSSYEEAINDNRDTSFSTQQSHYKGTIDHIAFNQNIFLKRWEVDPENPTMNSDNVRVYGLKDLAFSYFISNLIMTLSGKHYDNERFIWFPLLYGKESKRIYHFELNTTEEDDTTEEDGW